jgi:sugar diacid utilization regulator
LWSEYNRAVATDLIAEGARRPPRRARHGRRRGVPRAAPELPRGAPRRARHHTEEHHELLCEVLRRGRSPSERELAFVERHAARRARQRIPLAEFLEAFRTYHNIVWDAVLDFSRESPVAAEQALAATRAVIGYVDLATTRASAACLEAQQLLMAEGDRVRRDLLEDLLATGAPQTAAGVAAARAAGLEPDARCVLVAAVATNEPQDGALPRAAGTLAAALGGRHAPLAVTRHSEIVVARACARAEHLALRAPLANACERAASQGVVLAVGVSTVQDGRAGLGAAYREASQAVRRVAAGGGVLSLPDLSAFEYLTLRNDAVARRLIAPQIERFVVEDREQGGRLIDTLLAYAESDLNAKAAAERLLVHVNTAHYRLARIAEKTGCDLRRLPDVIDLLIAVRLTQA